MSPGGVHLVDLHHLGRPRVIGAWLLEGDEPALVDCGPSTCFHALERGLRQRGLELRDLRHLVLTHIHLDHAGAAGLLVREHRDLQVHVSEVGAPHLVDPSRLERSARRLYGDDFERLWGEVVPVPECNVHPIGAEVAGLEAFPTPGHASHHVSFLGPDGALYAGDVAGVRIPPSTYVAPVSPPPDIDVEAWERSLAEIEVRRPDVLRLAHFGEVDDPTAHLRALRTHLAAWSGRVRAGATVEQFTRAGEQELEREGGLGELSRYEQTAALWQSHAGLRRYWDRRSTSPVP